jgi:thioredoxin reductase (NADPH)
MMTTEVENFPGFEHGIMGPDLMAVMIKQAERFGSTLVYEDAIEVDFSKEPFMVKTGSKEFFGKTVIIATGAATRWLGIESETRLRGHGVSSCATCDGAFFKNKKVFIVGGGDSAMEEANFLTKFAASVTVIHRRDTLNASKIMQERAKANPKVDFIWDTEVVEVLGDQKVSGLKLRNVKSGETTEVAGDGLFLAIGHVPNTEIFKPYLELDAKGYLIVTDGTKSKVPGVFIAGDVHDYRYRQAITASGFGCMAALDAEKFLASKE